ncbi:MAG: DUF4202 domain-containing protein [Flavobacteriales bacterium]|nr:DUF4202 domain-containing protein [Flavobacteriales bacterium]
MMSKSIEEGIKAFDAANSKDPKTIEINGKYIPFELAFSDRLTMWIGRLTQSPSDALLLAARCQHIERWTKPRDSYPTGKTGYLNWRSDLKIYHAERSTEILKSLDFESDLIEQVSIINQKKAIKLNEDAQLMEDALCLEFLDFQLERFSKKYDDDKLITILKKSWKKMSENGRNLALQISYSDNVLALIKIAIS